jgi:hypothetical protein
VLRQRPPDSASIEKLHKEIVARFGLVAEAALLKIISHRHGAFAREIERLGLLQAAALQIG